MAAEVAPAEQVPVQMEDRLTGARPDRAEHAVVLEAEREGRLGDELEHPSHFLGRKLTDLAEGVDMPLGHDQDVYLRLGIYVFEGGEAIGPADVGAAAHQLAEEAVVRSHDHLAIPIIPCSVTFFARACMNSPTG